MIRPLQLTQRYTLPILIKSKMPVSKYLATDMRKIGEQCPKIKYRIMKKIRTNMIKRRKSMRHAQRQFYIEDPSLTRSDYLMKIFFFTMRTLRYRKEQKRRNIRSCMRLMLKLIIYMQCHLRNGLHFLSIIAKKEDSFMYFFIFHFQFLLKNSRFFQ